MLIPTGHEELRGRRWPWITLGIIGLNFLAFLATNWTLEEESQKLGEVKVHILLLAANHPSAEMPPAAQELVDAFKQSDPKLFEVMGDAKRRPEDEWDVEMRNYERAQANEEMARLAAQLEELRQSSVLEKHAFIPSRPTLWTYFSSMFLHGGWMHIIFNMWFLWLAGTVLEDALGRILYPLFYLASGAAATLAHQMADPNSIVPTLGASGAVSALMGAFLVRMARTKINFLFVYFITVVPRVHRFQAPAYLMLPLWLATQFFWAFLQGKTGGVAYWAHIGGFLFGVAGALVLRYTGIEHKVSKEIDGEVGWQADPRILKAEEMLNANPTGAVEELKALIKEKPNQTEAYPILATAQWKAGDIQGHNETLAALIRLHVKAKDFEHALKEYEEFLNQGGEKLPGAEWMQLIRWLESQQNWERAAGEYERYAGVYPSDRLAVYALVNAAKINLKQLNRKSEAARLYRAASASPVPHLDWDEAIKRGLREAEAP